MIISSDDDEIPRSNGSPLVVLEDQKGENLKSITCYYRDTDFVDLEKVANDVASQLRRSASPIELRKLENQIKDLSAELSSSTWTYVQYMKRTKAIQELRSKQTEIQGREKRYLGKIKELLNRWSTCIRSPTACFITEIDECINVFAKITSEFIPMSAVKVQTSCSNMCYICGDIGTLLESESSSGQLYCNKCKSGRQVLSVTNGRDVKGEDSSAGEDDGTETDRIEMMLTRFEGKQRPISQKVIKAVKEYLDSVNVLKTDQIRELILKDPSNRYGTSRSLLQEAMRATKNDRAYKDINAVAAHIWGWELPVLTQDFKDQIIADYRLTQTPYPEVRGDRRSRINADYRLLRHLVTRGFWHPILNEYKPAATSDVIDYHNLTWQKMCEKTGLPLVPMRW
jgi:vacuolar-type H+-ATPase subunit E/Vma4